MHQLVRLILCSWCVKESFSNLLSRMIAWWWVSSDLFLFEKKKKTFLPDDDCKRPSDEMSLSIFDDSYYNFRRYLLQRMCVNWINNLNYNETWNVDAKTNFFKLCYSLSSKVINARGQELFFCFVLRTI
jgi:hypothetical protein